MPGSPRSRFSPIARVALLSSLSTLSWADDECASSQRQRDLIAQDIAALREASDLGLKKEATAPSAAVQSDTSARE